MVSKDKSSIFFSPNTLVEKREEVCTMLDIMTEALTDKYLGLPTMVGMDRNDCFQFLIDGICKRINGYREISFSRWKRSASQRDSTSDTNICDVGL
jgi:hypothetical protein